MRPLSKTYDFSDADADGIADGNDSSGTSVTLDGTLTSGGTWASSDGTARRISLTDSSTSDQSDVTVTLTGTDILGNAQTEDLTGPTSGATVESTKYFKTLISATLSAAQGGSETMDIGIVDEAEAYPIVLDWHINEYTVAAEVTGTINYDIQGTFDEVHDVDKASWTWVPITEFDGKTATVIEELPEQYRAIRVIVNSFTNGAEIKLGVMAPGCH